MPQDDFAQVAQGQPADDFRAVVNASKGLVAAPAQKAPASAPNDVTSDFAAVAKTSTKAPSTSQPPPAPVPSFGSTLAREAKSTWDNVNPWNIGKGLYHAATAPVSEDEKAQWGQDAYKDAGPMGKLLGRSVVAPLMTAGKYYSDAAQGKHGDASAVESAMLQEAPEAIGAGAGNAILFGPGGVVPGATNIANGAPVGETIVGATAPGTVGGNVPLPFREATAPAIRTGVKAFNKVAPAAIATGTGALVGGALGHAGLGSLGGAEVGAGLGLSGLLSRGLRESVPKIPGEDFGLHPGDASITGEIKDLNTKLNDAWAARAKYKAQGMTDSPQYKAAQATIEGLNEKLTPLMRSEAMKRTFNAPPATAAPQKIPISQFIRNGMDSTPPAQAAPITPPEAASVPKSPGEVPPAVTRKNVSDAVDKGNPVEVPEGHTPIEGSQGGAASYKYDPDANELHVESKKTGVVHVHGDVSPEEAAAFENNPSKGKAWVELQKSHPDVAKIKDGVRTAVKPTGPRE